jgi:hypothetical protein
MFTGVLVYSCVMIMSFNGEPQAEAKSGRDACGLPLNELINKPLARFAACCFSKYYRAPDRTLSEISADESARSASVDGFAAVAGILAARSFESPR